jgi:kinesin family protein C2/C3
MLHPSSDAARALKYKIVENEAGQHVVDGAQLLKVDPTDTAQIAALLAYAGRLRSVAATAINPSSSRSHAVLTLHTKAVHTKRGVARHGQLNLVTPDINFPFFCPFNHSLRLHQVDLAGSERVEKSEVTGQALIEAKRINTSLSALSGVFLALGELKTGRLHVPYRDSKLTELLQPALAAQGRISVLLHLSPLESSLSESTSTLRFGTTVGAVELGKAKRYTTSTRKSLSPTRDSSGSDKKKVSPAPRKRNPARSTPISPPAPEEKKSSARRSISISGMLMSNKKK